MQLDATSELSFDIPSATDFDKLNISFSLNGSLNGDLTVNLEGGFLPSATDSFVILNASETPFLTSFNNVPDGGTLTTVGREETFIVNYDDDPGTVTLSNFEPAEFVLGDVNGDGVVNLLDVAPFVDAIPDGTFVPAADINNDGSVNLLDVAPFVA